MLRAVPVLRIFDEAIAKAFYLDHLGFSLDWEHRFEPDLPLYCQVTRAGMALHLSGHYGDATPGAKVLIYTDDVGVIHRELTAKRHPHSRPGLEDGPGEGLSVTVTDPFANRLVFYQKR